MFNRITFTTLAVLFAITFSGCLPKQFVKEEQERFDEAVKNHWPARLVQMCFDPRKEDVFGNFRAAMPGQQDKACKELKALYANEQNERYATALTKGDVSTLRLMCLQPTTYNKFTNEELGLVGLQKQACTSLKEQTAAGFDKATKAAIAQGGVPCLISLQKHFDAMKKDGVFVTEVQTPEAQQAAFAPHTDTCLAQIEATASAPEKRGDLYREISTSKFGSDAASLSDAQKQRLATVIAGLTASIATDYETQAAALKDEPAAAALYLASAAKMAKTGNDTARMNKDLAEARASLERAAIKANLSVALTGAGVGAEVVERIKAQPLGAGLEIAKSAPDLTFDVQLTAPSFTANKESVSLNAQIKEQKGTRTNPEWADQRERCDRNQKAVDHAADNCRRNGPRDSWCAGKPSHEKDLKWCLEKLARFKKEVPAFAMIDVPYEGMRYSGRSTGTLTIRQGAEAPKNQEVSTSMDRTANSAAPRANVSAVSASPISAPELKSSYVAEAAGVVLAQMRKAADARAAAFLDTALKATVQKAMAADLIRYAVISKNRPTGNTGKTVDEKLGIPAMDAIDLLFSAAGK